MTRYLVRRLLIAIPSLLGIRVLLFAVLALAPGDPFEELATNPAIPPEVRANLLATGESGERHRRAVMAARKLDTSGNPWCWCG